MKAMALEKITDLSRDREPLRLVDLPIPVIEEREILVKISVCGVCHTELDEIEGRTPPARFPMIPGHQIVGEVEAMGEGAERFRIGDRVGIAWIYSSCGSCRFCIEGNDNLCEDFKATGRDAHGGYAEYIKVLEDFAYKIPDGFSDKEAAPLLCAGAIGYRALRLTNIKDGENLGLTGFGSSAHLVIKIVKSKYPATRVFVFARDREERKFAKELGAFWTGDTGEMPPELLDCIIDTTPAWRPVVEALKNLRPGGRLVVNAIRKEDTDKDMLLRLDYPLHLWLEKEIKSVANVTRRDVQEFLDVAATIPIRPDLIEFPLEEANDALFELKEGKIRGSKVLRIVQ
ncbi:TPA: alcohol dehydrogenase [bacterium]|nr:alcohol dehydrogenase [bacterium]